MAFTDPQPGPGPAASLAGTGIGCLFAAILIFPLLIAGSLGASHCQMTPDCPRGPGLMFLWWLLLAAGPGLLLGAALRALFHWLGQRLGGSVADLDTAETRMPWWALVAVPIAIVGGTWLVWGEPLWALW